VPDTPRTRVASLTCLAPGALETLALTQQVENVLLRLVRLSEHRRTGLRQNLCFGEVGRLLRVIRIEDSRLGFLSVLDQIHQIVDGVLNTTHRRTHASTRFVDDFGSLVDVVEGGDRTLRIGDSDVVNRLTYEGSLGGILAKLDYQLLSARIGKRSVILYIEHVVLRIETGCLQNELIVRVGFELRYKIRDIGDVICCQHSAADLDLEAVALIFGSRVSMKIEVANTTTVSAGNSYVSTASPPYWKQEFDLTNLDFHRDTTPKNEGNSFEIQIGSRVLTADNVTDVTDLVTKLKSDSDYQFVLKAAGFDPQYDMFDVQDNGPLANPRTQKLVVKFGENSTERAFIRQSVNNVTIADPESAITALDYVDQAAKVVNESRARMGATMSRIEYTINNLMNLVENTEEAKSRVLDTDYAKESANLAKAQVLAQAGTAMLAQANQSQQYVLNLLRQG